MRLQKNHIVGAPATRCCCDVQNCRETSKWCGDGKMAPWRMAGRTFTLKNTLSHVGDMGRPKIWTHKGSPWASSGVLRDVLPDVPRPTLNQDHLTETLDEERPVPQHMRMTRDIIKRLEYTPICAKCKKLSRNEFSSRT